MNNTNSIVENPQAAAQLLNGWLTVITIGLAALASGLVHVYQIVVQAGGYRQIVRNFQGEASQPSAQPSKTVQDASKVAIPLLIALCLCNSATAQTNSMPSFIDLSRITPGKSLLFTDTTVTAGVGYNTKMKSIIEDVGVFTKLASNLNAGLLVAHDRWGFRSCAATANITGSWHGIDLSVGGGTMFDFNIHRIAGVMWTSAGYPVKVFGRTLIPTIALENCGTRLGNEYFFNITYPL